MKRPGLRERASLAFTSSRTFAGLVTRLADARLPKPLLRRLLRRYVKAYDVDLREIDGDLSSFATLNEFFTRRLRPGARPLAGPGCVVSPADALVRSIGTVPADGCLDQIKGRRYAIGALVRDEPRADRFAGGCHATLYLSPRDYHRVHCPADGRATGWRRFDGRRYPVHDRAIASVDELYVVNKRVVTWFDTDVAGEVAVVMVGASSVGYISLSEPIRAVGDQPVEVSRGDELGAFNLGSTVIVLTTRGGLRPAVEPGSHVKMGEALFEQD